MANCGRCGQSLIEEELRTHKCNPPTRSYESAEIVFHSISKDEYGNDLIIIKTVNGTLYSFQGIENPSPAMKRPYASPEDEDGILAAINNPYQGATRVFSSLKLSLGLVLAAVCLLALVPLAQAASSTSSASPSSGYAAYSVQVTQNGTTRAASVNESVTPSSSPGESIILLTVEGTQSNFTYSHVVNSSLTLFPYLPAISDQNFSYSSKSYTVAAKISQQGTSQVTFQGQAYTVTNYAFSADISSTNGSQTITGSVSAFPSDLVYSVAAQANGSSVAATLTATSLSLSASASAPALQAASAGIGLSLAAGAVALSLGVRMKRKQGPAGPSNPDHWVD